MLTQEKFNELLIEVIEQEKSAKRYANCKEIKVYHFKTKNSDKWLFDIDYDTNNPYFWFCYYKLYGIIKCEFGLHYCDLYPYLEAFKNDILKIKGITPNRPRMLPWHTLENALKGRDIGPSWYKCRFIRNNNLES